MLDAASQLDLGTSTTPAAVREWRNSFARINLIPLDLLSLISSEIEAVCLRSELLRGM